MTASPTTLSYLLGNAAASYGIPSIGGFSGSLTLPATTVPAGTRLALTSSLQAPAGAPSLQDAVRHEQATGTLNVYFYTTIELSSTVTFPTLPGFSVTLPATVNPTGLQFFYAISNPKPTNGAEVQFRTEGPATVSGQIVTFAPSTTSLILQAGQPYTIAFYAISAISAIGATGPNIYVTGYAANGGGLLRTYTADGLPTTPRITTADNTFILAETVDASGKIYLTICPDIRTAGECWLNTYDETGAPTTPTITGLTEPYGLAVDAAGKIYIADHTSNTLTTYTAAGVPTTPTIAKGLQFPWAIAVDAAGTIYVLNFGNIGNSYLTTYAPDGTQIAPTITGLSDVAGLVVDKQGKIYILSNYSNAAGPGLVRTYTANGTRTTPTILDLDDPQGMAVDAAGKIYVAQTGANEVTTYAANGVRTKPTLTLPAPTGVAVH